MRTIAPAVRHNMEKTMNATVSNIHQSKWGFHPCDVETYRKLKVIHKVYWESVFRMAAWSRWDRKHPQNRLQRFQGRGPDGKRIPLVPPIPLPEPTLPPFVVKTDHKRTVKTHVGDCKQYKGPIYDLEWSTVKLDPNIFSLVEDFQKARTPSIESQVRPLINSIEKIDAYYAKAQEWLAR